MAPPIQYIRRSNGEKISYAGHRQKIIRSHICEHKGLVLSRCAEAIHLWRLKDQHCLLAFPLSDPVGAEGYLSSDERWLILRDEGASAHASTTCFFVYELAFDSLEEVENYEMEGSPVAAGFIKDKTDFTVYGPTTGMDERRLVTLSLASGRCDCLVRKVALSSDSARQQCYSSAAVI